MAASVPQLVIAGPVLSNGAPIFQQPTTAGNFLIAIIAAGTTTPSACSDGTWTEATGARAIAAAAAKTQIFYKANCAANETPPTFTNTNFAQLIEFTLTGASAFTFLLDQTGNAVDQASGGNVTAGTADKNPAGNDLVITADFWRIASALDTTSDSYNNGATATNLANNDGTNTNNHYRFAYGVTTGNGAADKNTVTYSVAITHSAYSLATFRPVVQLAPTGIASAFAAGTANVVRVLAPTGIASASAFGTAAIRRVLSAIGVATSESFGAARVLRVLSPSGVVSGVAFGVAALRRILAPTGAPSSTAFGATSLLRVLAAVGITSGQTVGTANLLRLLSPDGIVSAQALGTANLVRVVAPTAIAPGGFGTPAAVRLIFPAAIAPAEAFGIPSVQGSAPPFAPIDTNVLVSDKLLYAAQISDTLLASVSLSDMLAASVAVSEG